MGRVSPVSAKTKKARMMAAREAAYIQSIGDAADYQRGRMVHPYDSFSPASHIKRRERFATGHMLTPTEQWLVAKGYATNPWGKKRSCVHKPWYTVTYVSGMRKSYRTLSEARQHLMDDNAEKLWNNNTHSYEWAKDRKGVM